MDMFMAGSETTSKSLGFGFLYLLLTPDVQEKAREEIDRVIGKTRSPNLNDRPKYVTSTIRL
jgi:cytochrome P450